MKRGAKNGGTIRHRSDGRWEARINLGRDPVTGKQKQMSVYAKTQNEARQKQNELTQERDAGKSIEPTKITVGDWLDVWKKDYLLNVRDSTRELYVDQIRLYLKPSLGSIKLCKLSNHDIQKLYKRLSDYLSPKSVKNIHGILHKALNQAITCRLINQNPSEGCELPKAEKAEISPMTDKQISAFLDAIKGHPYEVLYKTALFTGLREGELLGLRWDCIDFEAGTVLVNNQLRKGHAKDSPYYESPTKNGKSRIISPAPFVMDSLSHLRNQQEETAQRFGSCWEDSGFVFVNELGGHLYRGTVYNRFKRIVDSIGCPEIRFHDLRHTYAVNSLRAGDDIKTVQSNLGHSTAAFTLNIYAHYTSDMKQDSANRMDDFAKSKFCI